MIYSQIRKIYLLNLDFSANLEYFRLTGNFFNRLGKIRYIYGKPDPVLCIEKALVSCTLTGVVGLI